MLLHCLNYREKSNSKNPKVAKTNKEQIMISSKCAVCNSKKSRFIKEQEASWLLSSLVTKTLLHKISLVGPLLF